MTQVVLTRFRSTDGMPARQAFARELIAALDAAGIGPGEQFVVARHRAGVYAVPGVDGDAVGPHTRDSITSRNAALANFPRSGTQRFRILCVLATLGPRSRDELAERLRMPDSSTDARVLELLAGGWVRELAQTRRTRHGGDAKLLAISQRGREECEARGIA